MKTYILLFFLAISVGINAQTNLSEKEQKGLDELINSSITIDADAIKSQAISKILDAEFFEVATVYKHLDNELNSELMVVKHDGNFSKFYGVDELLPFFKSSYKMTSQEQATDFEKVLDKLFPVFYAGHKQIYQKDGQWFFIRDESFGEKEGVVVSVDDKGKVIDIEFKGGIE